MASTANNRISLPGFGRALNDYPYDLTQGPKGPRLRFPHAIEDEYPAQGVSVRERRMMEFVDQITDKPEWTRKVFDEGIVAKWRAEAVGYRGELNEESNEEDDELDEEGEDEKYLTEPTFSYVGSLAFIPVESLIANRDSASKSCATRQSTTKPRSSSRSGTASWRWSNPTRP